MQNFSTWIQKLEFCGARIAICPTVYRQVAQEMCNYHLNVPATTADNVAAIIAYTLLLKYVSTLAAAIAHILLSQCGRM